MEMTLTLKTEDGQVYYQPLTFKILHLNAGLAAILPTMENMPEECNGKRQMDWKTLSIEIVRK